MANLNNLEANLWEAADQLRANSKLTASEYSMPVLDLIFLRHATNRFMKIKAEIKPTLPTRDGVRASLKPDDFKGKAAIYLPEEVHYDYLAIISALQNRRVDGGTIVIGDLTVQGNIKGVLSLIEPLSIAMENGAVQALVPMSNKSQFTNLPEEVIEKIDMVLYGDRERVVSKGLE